MGEEKITIGSVAEAYGIEPAQVKQILDLSKFAKADSELDIKQAAIVAAAIANRSTPQQAAAMQAIIGSPEAQAVAKKSFRIFYWVSGKNFEFIADGARYASNKSVLKLDVVRDAAAIAYLLKHPKNEKNGGAVFAELDMNAESESDRGKFVDKLISMSVDQLAEMAGGGIASKRKSKGTLISEILSAK